MGLIQSILCSVSLCVERVLTWACCAFLLVLVMFMLVVLMAYGISVGYHYAQKELAAFAAESIKTTPEVPTLRRAASGIDPRPVVRLVAVNRTREGHGPLPLIETHRTSKPKERILMDPTITPIIVLETERSPQQTELSPNEREIAKKLIGRFRRSKNLILSLKNETNLFRFPIPI